MGAWINRKVVILLFGALVFGATETFWVKDSWPAETNLPQAVSSTAVMNGKLYFFFENELWKSDGTAVGTTLVKNPNFGSASALHSLTEVKGTLFFIVANGLTGIELWKSDGTESGTLMVKTIKPDPSSPLPRYLTNVDGALFFAVDDGKSGIELWKSDGTAAGTRMVKDVRGGGPSLP
jgi:ELWxxDGT repeat protein